MREKFSGSSFRHQPRHQLAGTSGNQNDFDLWKSFLKIVDAALDPLVRVHRNVSLFFRGFDRSIPFFLEPTGGRGKSDAALEENGKREKITHHVGGEN